MSVRKVAEEGGLAILVDDEAGTVTLHRGGGAPGIVMLIDAWRRPVAKWNDYDKREREANIDQRIFGGRPDSWD